MRLVVDASALVADLLRAAGRTRIADERLELFIAEHTSAEVTHELPKRVGRLAGQRGLSVELSERLVRECLAAVDHNLIVVPEAAYAPREEEARWRSPRDPDDWPVVAAALAVGGGVWTNDNDFLGTGIATWTTGTLISWLAHTEDPPP